MTDEDTFTIEVNAREAMAVGLCILYVARTKEIPEHMREDLKSFSVKNMAAIEAQKGTDWEVGF